MPVDYPDTQLFIGGRWKDGSGGKLAVRDPATEDRIGDVGVASKADLDAAVEASQSGFLKWRATSAYDRSKLMRRAGDLLRERADRIAALMTKEQGKPIAQSTGEVLAGADIIDWFAEEGRRAYGQVVPSRAPSVLQLVVKEPVGPVAAFAPWNFPINQSVRKVSAALAAGCSMVLKGAEETPASVAQLVRCYADAGLPPGVLNLVFGVPAEISAHLIPHPAIRKVTFTGSTPVGKQLAALAGLHMKRVTMELGGHAPAIVFADADIDRAVQTLVLQKYRNAGQVCVSPTRFLVEDAIYDEFSIRVVAAANAVKVGAGDEPGVQMGPLANDRRLSAMQRLVDDAVAKGARLLAGGHRIGNRGYFYAPTVLADVPADTQVMNEEPFGPIALLNRFGDFEDAVAEANRLPFGLAAYAYTGSGETANRIGTAMDAGMISINHHGVGLPELPFGGIKESGYGTEGGSQALEAYLNAKLVTRV